MPTKKHKNVRPKKEHTDEFIETRRAQMEIMGRAVALKKMAYPMKRLMTSNRLRRENREEKMRETLDRFGTEDALNKQYDACRMSTQAYYDARRMIRQGIGLEGTWPTAEEVAERVLLEKYDEIYKEMVELEQKALEQNGTSGYKTEIEMRERIAERALDILKNSEK